MADNKLVKHVSQKVISSQDEMVTFLKNLKEVTYPLFPETVNFGIRPEFKLSGLFTILFTNRRVQSRC